MKTSIIITGQISGNFKLRQACWCEFPMEIKLPFGNIELEYRTKKDAIYALQKAFKELKDDEYDFYKDGGIVYLRGYSLAYDASIAKLITKQKIINNG